MRRRNFSRRSARRRAVWTFASAVATSGTDGASATFVTFPMLPAGRINWVLENAQRQHITVKRLLVWLSYYWTTPDTGTGPWNIPDADLYIATDMTGLSSSINSRTQNPFLEPAVPTAVANWDSTLEDDGLASLMWCHHLFGRIDRSTLSTQNEAPPAHGNTTSQVAGQTGAQWNNDPYRVSASWQPDLDLRVMRKLAKNWELYGGFRLPGTNTGMKFNLNANWRVLTV